METYLQVSITVGTQEQKDILVALLSDAGFEGFAEERDQLQSYIAAEGFDKGTLEAILQPMQLSYQLEEIRPRNWNAEWEAGFEPVQVSDFCSIRADFHPPATNTRYEIIITPKMSFGTGHHATTYMMVEAMQEFDLKGKRVLDFGTGTGVLAILAAKMGAEKLLAVDNDSWSIENAGENFSRNDAGKIILQQEDTIPPAGGKFDVILANINKNVVLKQLHVMKEHLAENGAILISGLLQTDAPDLAEAIERNGLALTGKWERNSWLCWRVIIKEK